MAHGFICPRLLSLSWDTNTHNEHIYFQFDVQNGRGLHEGSHFHYKNQKHKHSEITSKVPLVTGSANHAEANPTPPKSLRRQNPHQLQPRLSSASLWSDSPWPFRNTACGDTHGCHHSGGPLACSGGLQLSLGRMAGGRTHSSDPDVLR